MFEEKATIGYYGPYWVITFYNKSIKEYNSWLSFTLEKHEQNEKKLKEMKHIKIVNSGLAIIK